MSINRNNLAQKTTWYCGSSKLDLMLKMTQDFSIPGINFNHPQVFNHSSAPVNFVADNITFNSLTCEVLIDENYKVYFEVMKKIFDQFNPTNGTFATQEFDWFTILTNNKGNDIFKIDYYNCRFESVSDVTLTTQGDESFSIMSIGIKYDYFLINDLDKLASNIS